MTYSYFYREPLHESYIADVHHLAHDIEASFADVLQPAAGGLYLPYQLDPVVTPQGRYWFQEPVAINSAQAVKAADVSGDKLYGDVLKTYNQPWQYYRYNYIPVNTLEQILQAPWDVVEMAPGFMAPYYNPQDAFPGSDAQPRRVVVPHHLNPQLLTAPNLPVRGIRLLQAILENEVAATRHFQSLKPVTMESLFLPFLRPESLPASQPGISYQATCLQFLQQHTWFQRELNHVFDCLLVLLQPVREMLRQHPYRQCRVQHQDGLLLKIDLLEDVRIQEWERLQHDPDYARYLQAKQDGSWDRFVARETAYAAPTMYDLQQLYR